MAVTKTKQNVIVGQQLKTYLAVNNISREEFARKHQLGKSTIDKFITGRFTEGTLAKVLERSPFRLKTQYASAILGAYSRASWDGYISPFLMLTPAIDGSDAIQASQMSIEWDDALPGLALYDTTSSEKDHYGALWIPKERSPLIYIQPIDGIELKMIVSTMVGEPCMRGLIMTIGNEIANTFIPLALPVVLQRLEADEKIPKSDLGRIELHQPKYNIYSLELQKVVERKFVRFVTWEHKVRPVGHSESEHG